MPGSLPHLPQDGTLLVLRGNSGAGKSIIARALHKRLDYNRSTLIAQDNIRRTILHEPDIPSTTRPLLCLGPDIRTNPHPTCPTAASHQVQRNGNAVLVPRLATTTLRRRNPHRPPLDPEHHHRPDPPRPTRTTKPGRACIELNPDRDIGSLQRRRPQTRSLATPVRGRGQ